MTSFTGRRWSWAWLIQQFAIDHVVTDINILPHIFQRHATQTQTLYTQVSTFRDPKDIFFKFEHFLLNHLQPHRNGITGKNKLYFLQNFWRDKSIVFWQT